LGATNAIIGAFSLSSTRAKYYGLPTTILDARTALLAAVDASLPVRDKAVKLVTDVQQMTMQD